MNLEWFLRALVRTSVQAGVLVLIILLGQWLFQRRMPPRWRASLWLLVIARLLLPIAPESPASLFNFLPPWEAKVSRLPIPVSLASPTAPTPPTIAPTFVPPAVIAPAKASTRTRVPWIKIVFGCWLAGVVLLSGRVVLWSVLLGRRLRRLPVLQSPSVQFLFQDCARQMHVVQSVRLVESAEIHSPVLHGLTRPSLVLPTAFLERHGSQTTRFVFLHELAHLKRRDLLFHWIVTALQIVYWFNPLIWIGFYRWRVDRELACDAMALEAAGGNQSREYGRALLHLLESLGGGPRMSGLIGQIGMLEGKRDLRRRVEMILRFRPVQRSGYLSAALMAGLAFVTLTNAQVPRITTTPPSTGNPNLDATGLKIAQLEAAFSEAKSNILKLSAFWYELKDEPIDNLVSWLISMGVDPELTELLRQFKQAEMQRSALSPDLGPDHPEVQKADRALSTLKKQIAHEATGSLGYLKTKLTSECAAIENMFEEIDRLNSEAGGKQDAVQVIKPGKAINPQSGVGLRPVADKIVGLKTRRAEAIASFRESNALLHGLLLTLPRVEIPRNFPAMESLAELTALNSQLSRAELMLRTVARDLGPEHPDVKRLLQTTATLKDQIGRKVDINLPEALRRLRFDSDMIDAVQREIEAERNRQ